MLQNSTKVTEKKRHGCLTAYLLILSVFSLVALILYLLRAIGRNDSPVWESLLFAAIAFIDIVCAVAIFNWKRWGVWGLCAVAFIGFIISIIQGNLLIIAIINLTISVGLLFIVLNIGDENKGWPQLK